ncbi:MAG: DegT/DnrJ/EryC1/StrS family aminotransferase [Nitrososphaerota archaeon]|jgi:perosamine synthetase|nr:DegT/DnrJ/EryC1/StrS family aminotransferase [Nitrososphaerota archaeon]
MNFKIPVAEPDIDQEELNNVIEALKSGWISSKGRFIIDLEEQFAHFSNAKFGIATSNGTAALHLALEALDIKPGDEVIIPSLTFIASANVVKYVGAHPVFVDSHPDYWCIDPEKIEEKITDKTRAIMPVHLYGHPCDMDPILRIAKKHNLFIIEDCAEAHGAEYRGKKVGSFGIINCFSFYGNKIITTGEGGMCLTDDPDLSEKLRVLRDHGMSSNKRYWHDVIGFNYRMTNIQAAIGLAQLSKIDLFIEKKRQIARLYNKLLQGSALELPPEMSWAKNVYWMYSILVNSDGPLNREYVAKGLCDSGIDTRPFFYPLTVLPPYKETVAYPVAERLSCQGLNLPSGVKLSTENIVEIVSKLKLYYNLGIYV